MADRTRYLLAYDIRDARRLRRVHKVAKDFGDPLQYSVFICDLTAVELMMLRGALLTEINTKVDSVCLCDLGPAAGVAVRKMEFLGVRRPMPEEGPAIW